MDMKNDKEKKQIPLRLSPTLWMELAAWAEDDFRSINGQIEYLLTESVRQRRKPHKELPASSPDGSVPSKGDAGSGPG
ncbi:MAG: type II toxin-antitoxin system antitoxin [Saccharofermentanales bacterium]